DTTPNANDSTTTVPDPGETTSPDGSTTSTTEAGPGQGALQRVELELIQEGIRQPVGLTAPVGDDRLFIAQRGGFVRVIDADRNLLETPFLDLTGKVLAGGIEQGLLGLAFH